MTNEINGDCYVVAMITRKRDTEEELRFYTNPTIHRSKTAAYAYAKTCLIQYPEHIGFTVLKVIGTGRRTDPVPPIKWTTFEKPTTRRKK